MRKPRADAVRNRERLLSVAKAAFTERGERASMDEIARAAGVGAGTLYRHFPTREALVAAVYLSETEQLARAAEDLAGELPALDALRAWLATFVDYIVTKRAVAGLLEAMPGGPSALYAESWGPVDAGFRRLMTAAEAAGHFRLTFDPLNLLKALAVVASTDDTGPPGESARRLARVLVDGLLANPS